MDPTGIKTMVEVKDVFEIKPMYGLDCGIGIVVVVNHDATIEMARVGVMATIATPDGVSRNFEIAQVKCHGTARSLFFKNVKSAEVPRGCSLAISSRSRDAKPFNS